MKISNILKYKKLSLFFVTTLVLACASAETKGGGDSYTAQNTSTPSNSQSVSDIKARFQADKENIQRSYLDMQNIHKDTVADIKARNLKFKVEITEQMKYQISQITGASIDETDRKDANVQ